MSSTNVWQDLNFPIVIKVDSNQNIYWVARVIEISEQDIRIYSFRPVALNIPIMIYFPFEWQQDFVFAIAFESTENEYCCHFIDLPRKIRDGLDREIGRYIEKHLIKTVHEED